MRHQEQLKRIMQDYREIERQFKAGYLTDPQRMAMLRDLPQKYQNFWERLFQI